jgi:hypothetical protein
MKALILAKLTATALCLVPPALWAQPSALDDAAPAASPNRFGLSYRMLLNTPVSFKNLGGYTLPLTRTTPSGDPYNYQDGYVYRDPNGAANPAWPYTWYWGYDAAPNQYSLGNPSVIMHRSSSEADGTSPNVYDAPASGFEVTYDRELYHSKFVRIGPEAAFGYTTVSYSDSSAFHQDVTVSSDAYGVPVDPASGYGVTYFPTLTTTGQPYQHGFNRIGTGGSDPLIFSGPVSLPTQVLPGAATVTGYRNFDANLFGFRFGPYFEFPLSRTLSVGLSGGFALVYVTSDFSYNETVAIAGLQPAISSGSGSHSDWLPGGYVAGTISWAFAEQWALTAGAQFEDVGRYTQVVNGKQAVLDLSQAIFVTFGITYAF